MEDYSIFFPYSKYRPHQKQMLDFAYNVIKNGEIGLINAPTGSGKTTVLSAALAAVNNDPRPIIIASRMVSQIQIYTKELDLIRTTKKPNLKFGYIIGKNKSCKRFDEHEKQLLNRCRKLCKNHQKNLINTEQILEECSWYANSIESNEGNEKIEASPQLIDKIHQFITTTVDQSEIKTFSEPCCPYEVMKNASNFCDVIICNYHHLLNPIFRKALFSNLFNPPTTGKMNLMHKSPVVIFDEAHNLPDTISNLFSISLNKATIDQIRDLLVSSDEEDLELITHIRAFLEDPTIKPLIESEGFTIKSTINFLIQTIIASSKFLDICNIQKKKEVVIDPEIFLRLICCENNEDNLRIIVKKIRLLSRLIELFKSQNNNEISNSDLEEDNVNSLSGVLNFLSTLIEYYDDPSVIKIFVKKETEETTNDPQLKLKFIDPEPTMKEIASLCHSILLMSGTLHPPEAYGQILFGVQPGLRIITLPNSFPKENRKLIIVNDCSTRRSRVIANKGENKNNRIIEKYVSKFAEIPGNIAIFCPSYSMVTKIQKTLKESNKQNVFLQPKNNDETLELIKKFFSLPNQGAYGILLGVSGGRLSEGIDYLGDSLIGVMVLGLPLARYDLVEKAKIRYYQRKFGSKDGDFLAYTLPAFNRSLQAIGRVIRSESDKGIMILCDERFLDQKIYDKFPDWMIKEVMITNISHFSNKCSIPN